MTKCGETTNRAWYDKFYSTGGWNYTADVEVKRLKTQLFDHIDLALGSTVLDVGCGLGAHTEAIRRLGYKPTGVDFSGVAIEEASKQYPDTPFFKCDVEHLNYPNNHFDMVFIRGLSWYHYELDDTCLARSKYLMNMVRPGGYMALIIQTDFSGETNPDSGVLFNKLSAYTRLFSKLGKIVLCTDWDGNVLTTNKAAVGKNNIVIVVQKKKKATSRLLGDDNSR